MRSRMLQWAILSVMAAGCGPVQEPAPVVRMGVDSSCAYLQVPSDTGFDVRSIAFDFSPGTTSTRLYLVDDAHDEKYCTVGGTTERWHLVYQAVTPQELWVMPEATALHLQSHQQLAVVTNGIGELRLEPVPSGVPVQHLGTMMAVPRAGALDGDCRVPHPLELTAVTDALEPGNTVKFAAGDRILWHCAAGADCSLLGYYAPTVAEQETILCEPFAGGSR